MPTTVESAKGDAIAQRLLANLRTFIRKGEVNEALILVDAIGDRVEELPGPPNPNRIDVSAPTTVKITGLPAGLSGTIVSSADADGHTTLTVRTPGGSSHIVVFPQGVVSVQQFGGCDSVGAYDRSAERAEDAS